jgi:hypothetical protein
LSTKQLKVAKQKNNQTKSFGVKRHDARMNDVCVCVCGLTGIRRSDARWFKADTPERKIDFSFFPLGSNTQKKHARKVLSMFNVLMAVSKFFVASTVIVDIYIHSVVPIFFWRRRVLTLVE